MIDFIREAFETGADRHHDKIRTAMIDALAENHRVLTADQILDLLQDLAPPQSRQGTS